MPKVTCDVDGCEKRARARGWCSSHYSRWKRYGNPTAGTPKRRRAPSRECFEDKIGTGAIPTHRPDLGPCSVWTGFCDPSGYAKFSVEEQSAYAHRWAWEQIHGPVPEGLELDHLCHNGSGCAGGATCPHRRCVNPAHLEAVTHHENLLRGVGPASRTHCPQGHPYDEANTYRKPNGNRECRICQREGNRRRYTASRTPKP